MRALSSRDDCAAGNGTRVVSSTISGIEMPGRENLERAGRLDLRQNLDHLHPGQTLLYHSGSNITKSSRNVQRSNIIVSLEI